MAPKKRTIRMVGGQLPAKWSLTAVHLRQAVLTARSLCQPGMAELFLLSWEFLFRVQSEGVPLEAGVPGEGTCLSPERHSAVFIDAELCLNVRLQRRKHRPRGSLLRRPCTCRQDNRFCVVHKLQGLLASKALGERLFDFTSYQVLKALRQTLGLLGVEGAQAFTLKAFRAGRATAMAAEGANMAAILQAGEWRSWSALRYIDPDQVDQAHVMRTLIAASDDEVIE